MTRTSSRRDRTGSTSPTDRIRERPGVVVGFNDSSWAQGPAELGYGDGDEATTVPRNGLVSYYRQAFTVDNPASITSLDISVRRDDGAVIYLNGTEIMRSAMPGGTITNSTQATTIAYGANETNYFSTTVDPGPAHHGYQRGRRPDPQPPDR